jgi:MFS family permease
MTKQEGKNNTAVQQEEKKALVSWLPLIIIVMVQMQMGFNVSAIPVSIGPIVEELYTPATSVGTALVIYSLFVAAFVMLGAKIGRKFGERLVFQITTLLHGFAMILMASSQDALTMNLAQALAGLAAAALVPTLVVLIAANYRDRQQAKALGVLAGAPAMSGALAFFIAGFLGTFLSWRYSFALLAVVSLVAFLLSFKIKAIPRYKEVQIDLIGALLAAVAIILISFGFNNLNSWGLVTAKDLAPFALLGLSPAPFMIIIGILFGQSFFSRSIQRVREDKAPLIAMEIFKSRMERSTIIALLFISGLGPAVNFLIPLYIQIVQNRSTVFTAVAVIPYTLAIATAAILIVRFFDRFSPRLIATVSFILAAAGLTLLSYTIANEWGTPLVVLSLIIIGLAEGSLVTLLFNVMVSAAPKELAGDVGAVRGVANNLSTALGTAFAGVVAVGLLSTIITGGLMESTVPNDLKNHINFDNVSFISNDSLEEFLSETAATPEEIAEAVNINIESRLQALKASFLILAGISLLAIIPSMGLPGYRAGEVPTVPPPAEKSSKY